MLVRKSICVEEEEEGFCFSEKQTWLHNQNWLLQMCHISHIYSTRVWLTLIGLGFGFNHINT